MNGSEEPDRADRTGGDTPGTGPPGPPIRRHLIVLGIGVVGLVVGIVLVLTGRSSSEPSRSHPDSGSVASAGPLLPDLGSVADDDAARTLVGGLDPNTLEPDGAPASTATATSGGSLPASDVDLTETGVQRCQQAIAQQNPDRSLGRRLAAARLVVDHTPTLVVSYELPASGADPAGLRVVVADARTCRILTAVEH